MATNRVCFETAENASCVEFCPYKESSGLLAVGQNSKIVVKECFLKDEPGLSLLEALTFKDVFALFYGEESGVSHVSWSPATSYSGEGAGKFVFCACGTNHNQIKVFSSDLKSISYEVLPGHQNYINDLCTHPNDPTLLASVGDDRVCRLWDITQGQLRSEFRLGSPGMSVRWHPHDPVKLLVAEKAGRIRIYDLATEVPIQSLDVFPGPLMSADWSPSNSLRVGGVSGENWCLWDVSKSSQPLEVKTAHQGPTTMFRWCAQSDCVFATVGLGSQIKVHHTGHQKVPIICDLPVVSDVSWHTRLPLLAAASDQTVQFWITET